MRDGEQKEELYRGSVVKNSHLPVLHDRLVRKRGHFEHKYAHKASQKSCADSSNDDEDGELEFLWV